MTDDDLEQARNDAYKMGYADGQGDLPERVRTFLESLINEEDFRKLPKPLRKEAQDLTTLHRPDVP